MTRKTEDRLSLAAGACATIALKHGKARSLRLE
jgi:hypothetical protein